MEPTWIYCSWNCRKLLYSAGLDLEELLQLTIVDAPVAMVTLSAILPTDIAEGLKAEDKKAELGLHKRHQVAAWVIRSATVASFFNRASLIWLDVLLCGFDLLDFQKGNLKIASSMVITYFILNNITYFK